MDWLYVLTEVVLLLGCFPLLGSSVTVVGPPETRVKPNHVLSPTKTSVDIHGYASDNAGTINSRRSTMSTVDSSDLGKCILLFGAFCNGNLGDVVQPIAMKQLLSSVAPDQCFWFAHPRGENQDRGHRIGEFFGGEMTSLIHLDSRDAELVNKFKALIIGGGGIFVSQHFPLYVDEFAEGLKLPIIVMGVGASSAVKKSAVLVEKALFVSGRDATSTHAFSDLLRNSKNPAVQPDDVVFVRDPVLSYKALSDEDGKCWKQSEDENHPLCFVLPASNTASTAAMHQQFISNVVRPGDVFVNVFPKHQDKIEAHGYPGKVETILEPFQFTERLCSCRAIISSRLHGVILGLHMGVPTFAAFYVSSGNKVSELMLDIMRLPEQFFLINEHLTRPVIDLEVDAVRQMYINRGRRAFIHARLSQFYYDFECHAKHVLFDIIGEPPHESSTPERTERDKLHLMANEQEPRIGTAPTRVVDIVPKGVEQPESKEKASDQVAESKGLTASEGKLESRAGRTALQSPATASVTTKASAPELMEAEASRESRKSVAEALIALRRHIRTGTDTGTSHAKHDTEEESAVKTMVAPPPAEITTTADNNARGRTTDSHKETWDVTTIVGVLLVNDYLVVFFLIASIMVLALLPMGGTTRRTPHDIAGKEIARGGSTNSRKDVAPRFASDTEQVAYQKTMAIPPATGAPGVAIAATSSKILFMLNFAAWVSLAIGFGVYGKSYLLETRDPVRLLILQGTAGILSLYALGHCGAPDLHPQKDMTPGAVRHLGLVAILYTGQTFLTNFALLAGGIAVGNAVEAVEPVAAAVFSYVLLGKKCSLSRLAAVLAIVSGLFLLTSEKHGHDERFKRGGGSAVLVSAVFTFAAVCCNALCNTLIKRGNPISPHQALFACSGCAMVVGVAMMMLRQSSETEGGEDATATRVVLRPGESFGWIRASGVKASLCFVGYSLASFKLLARLTPIGHAVGNSCKRMLVFTCGLLILGKVMSLGQLGGAVMAILGVLGYNLTGNA